MHAEVNSILIGYQWLHTLLVYVYPFRCILLLTAKPKKTLFIKNLPLSTTEDEVKALSPDIQEVRLEATKNTGDKKTKYVRGMLLTF